MKRHALFVGINRYTDQTIQNLQYAVADATELEGFFRWQAGFDSVKSLTDPDSKQILDWIKTMKAGLASGDEFLFFFSGHGIKTQNGHRLVCFDDALADVKHEWAGLPLERLKAATAGPFNRLFLLDACRTDVLATKKGSPGAMEKGTKDVIMQVAGEAKNQVGALTVVCSCDDGQCAVESPRYGHGVFTEAMLELLTNAKEDGRELSIDDTFVYTQLPERMQSLLSEEPGMDVAQKPQKGGPAFLILPGAPAAPASRPSAAQPVYVSCPECGGYNLITDTFKCKVCGRDHLCKSHRDAAANCCSDCAAKVRQSPSPLSHSSPTQSSKLSRTSFAPGEARTVTLPGGAPLELVWCPAGTFWMGSENGEEGRYDGETFHRVTLTRGFWMGETPVTQGQWKSVMGNNPSHFTGDDALPVEKVSWDDCAEFIKKANAGLSGVRLRLPTEAEWEYACRAGTTGAYGGTGNLDEMGWYFVNSGARTHPVGRKKPNDWGLHDMHGNVWEWCADRYGDYPKGDATDPTGPASGGYRVLRGGCWYSYARICRSADRFRLAPGGRRYDCGFRLCCSAGPRGQETE